ncbi:MAG: hypothetical protein HRT36_02705 [Alphaproteobacteria bacterium]|nr:hypothetical protein [Alphaproteobacteria bacterium]
MSTTADDILQEIMRCTGVDETPETLSNTNKDIQQILNFMNQAGAEILSRAEWSKLLKEQDIAANATEHTLPSDFHRLAEQGGLIDKKNRVLRRAKSFALFSMVKNNKSAVNYFFIDGSKIMFSSKVGFLGASVKYVSENWCQDHDGAGKTKISLPNDHVLLPAYAIVVGAISRWRRNIGLENSDYNAEFESVLDREFKSDRGV